MIRGDLYFEAGVKEVAEKLGFDKYSINFEKGVDDGVNYVGEIHRLNIVGPVNGESHKVNLICKVLGKDEIKRKIIPLNKLAVRECHIYNDIFPAFDDLQDKYEVRNKFTHPTCYLATAKPYEEIIFMEDLSKLNRPFVLPKCGQTLDFEHAELFLEALGKFHALSLALKHHSPIKFGELVKDIVEIQINSKINPKLQNMVTNAYNAVTKRAPEAKEVLDEKMDGAFDKTDWLMDEREEPYAVISHGDIWCYNMLYTYKADKPETLMLIDWQAIRYTSPVVDLLFGLFVCINEDSRENDLPSLLKIYYKSLADHLLQLRCEPEQVYPEGVFYEHMKKYLSAVLVHCFMMMPIFFKDHSASLETVLGDDNVPRFGDIVVTDLLIGRVRQMAKDVKRILAF